MMHASPRSVTPSLASLTSNPFEALPCVSPYARALGKSAACERWTSLDLATQSFEPSHRRDVVCRCVSFHLETRESGQGGPASIALASKALHERGDTSPMHTARVLFRGHRRRYTPKFTLRLLFRSLSGRASTWST